MEYRRLGRTGLKISNIALGCMTFGGQVEPEAALSIIDRALEGGVNLYDTADVYTGGRSEEILGRALKG
ncbi:MAG: aldo/keto reductase, partial [Chloroflexi bacterium]|nr:aldo/keto reductase [Chloroflexota bacterium]